MAMVSLICPQCGAALELEDKDRDYGFCSFCGCRVQLHEVISVKHSGSVSLDNSYQATNRLQIADRAYEARNYSEAHNYYTKVLEDLPGNYTAIYRKGMCAIHMAGGDLPAGEFSVAMKAAGQALVSTRQLDGKSSIDLIAQKDRDILEMLIIAVLTFDPVIGAKFSSQDTCNAALNRLLNRALFAPAAISFIDAEAVREKALTDALNFCDLLKGTTLEYPYTVTNGNGQTEQKTGRCRLNNEALNSLKATRAALAQAYNTLPSRLERERNLSAGINILSGEIKTLEDRITGEEQALKAAKAAFWNANPAFAKGRIKALIPSFIIGGISLIALVLCFIFDISLGIVLAPGGIVLAVLLGIRFIRNYEAGVFNESITGQIAAIEADKNTLNEKKNQLKKENDQLKEYNKSKR